MDILWQLLFGPMGAPMGQAQGAVQQYSYKATFPLLLNVSDQPTYFMALKDSAGLVKMYAMVNVQQYQVVATGYSLEECRNNYHAQLVSNKLIDEEALTPPPVPDVSAQTVSVSGAIADIRSANIDGNTVFYFLLEGGNVYYTISAKTCPAAVLLNPGDTITLNYVPQDSLLVQAESLMFDPGF